MELQDSDSDIQGTEDKKLDIQSQKEPNLDKKEQKLDKKNPKSGKPEEDMDVMEDKTNFVDVFDHMIADSEKANHSKPTKVKSQSENGGDLKSGLVWISNGQKEVGFRTVQILNGI